jgi:hypothetical protein
MLPEFGCTAPDYRRRKIVHTPSHLQECHRQSQLLLILKSEMILILFYNTHTHTHVRTRTHTHKHTHTQTHTHTHTHLMLLSAKFVYSFWVKFSSNVSLWNSGYCLRENMAATSDMTRAYPEQGCSGTPPTHPGHFLPINCTKLTTLKCLFVVQLWPHMVFWTR